MHRHHRVVVAGVGDDARERVPGAVSRVLRDGGFEVIDTGPGQRAAQVAATVLQEDADAVGVILPPTAPGAVLADVLGALAALGLDDVVPFAVADHADRADDADHAGPGPGATEARSTATLVVPAHDPAAVVGRLTAALHERDTVASGPPP